MNNRTALVVWAMVSVLYLFMSNDHSYAYEVYIQAHIITVVILKGGLCISATALSDVAGERADSNSEESEEDDGGQTSEDEGSALEAATEANSSVAISIVSK